MTRQRQTRRQPRRCWRGEGQGGGAGRACSVAYQWLINGWLRRCWVMAPADDTSGQLAGGALKRLLPKYAVRLGHRGRSWFRSEGAQKKLQCHRLPLCIVARNPESAVIIISTHLQRTGLRIAIVLLVGAVAAAAAAAKAPAAPRCRLRLTGRAGMVLRATLLLLVLPAARVPACFWSCAAIR